MVKTSKWGELRRGWPVLIASMWGTGAGLAGLSIYNLGLFANDLSSAIGLSRTAFGVSILMLTVGSAIGMPIVGWAIDRFDARWPSICSAVGLSACFLALGTIVDSTVGYFVALIAMGFLAASSTAVSYSRVVATWFDRARGFALGVTQAGIGISSVIVPLLVARSIQSDGWRSGYLLLSVVAATSIPVIFFLLRPNPEGTDKRKAASRATDADFAAARKTGIFWLLMGTMALMSITFFGLVAHFVPMLRDAKIGAIEASKFASLMGISIVLSRLVVGWLADVMHARWLGPLICILSGLGCLGLASGQEAFLPFSALMLGIAVGAEGDLLGFLSSRYFSLAVYGRVYAWLYGVFILSAGASPAWIGWTYDHWGGYKPALYIVAALTLVMTLLFRLMPNYPIRGAQHDEASESRSTSQHGSQQEMTEAERAAQAAARPA